MLFFVLIPILASALLIYPLKKRLAAVTAITGTAGSLAMSAYYLYTGFGKTAVQAYTWMTLPYHLASSINLIAVPSMILSVVSDNLSLFMLVLVSFVSLMVLFFSTFYMKKEPQKRFYAEMSFFIFSMLGLVMSNSLLLFFIFWEFVGVSSYLLISFWYSREAPSAAGKKAFVITRIGDMALLSAIVILYSNTGTFSLTSILGNLQLIPSSTLYIVSSLVIIAAFSKAAQFPFYPWLVAAMEGPTPVSALLHSATMVAAGAYLSVLMFPMLEAAALLPVLVVFGFITAVIGALLGLKERHSKRILAYSTVESLAFMFLAIGTANTGGAIFYLFAHAVFKSMLFFIGGVVAVFIGTYDIYKISTKGVKNSWLLVPAVIGFSSISALPPFISFFAHAGITYGFGLYENIAFVIVSFLTALFSFRALFVMFRNRGKKVIQQRSGAYIPVYLLAAISIFGGVILFFFNGLIPIAYRFDIFSYVSLAATLFGVYIAWGAFYVGRYRSVVSRFYSLAKKLDKYSYDKILDRIGRAFVGFGKVISELDRLLSDSFSRMAEATFFLSSKSRSIENGDALSYIDGVFVGLVIILLLVVVLV